MKYPVQPQNSRTPAGIVKKRQHTDEEAIRQFAEKILAEVIYSSKSHNRFRKLEIHAHNNAEDRVIETIFLKDNLADIIKKIENSPELMELARKDNEGKISALAESKKGFTESPSPRIR